MRRLRVPYDSSTTSNSAFEANLWRNNLYLPVVVGCAGVDESGVFRQDIAPEGLANQH